MTQKKPRPRWRLDGSARMTPDLAKEMLAALAASELSVSAFARLHEIPKQRICYWRRRMEELEAAQKPRLLKGASRQPSFAPVIAKPSPLLEVRTPSRSSMQTLEATLPGGSRVVVHGQWDSTSVQVWLSAIAGGPC